MDDIACNLWKILKNHWLVIRLGGRNLVFWISIWVLEVIDFTMWYLLVLRCLCAFFRFAFAFFTIKIFARASYFIILEGGLYGLSIKMIRIFIWGCSSMSTIEKLYGMSFFSRSSLLEIYCYSLNLHFLKGILILNLKPIWFRL